MKLTNNSAVFVKEHNLDEYLERNKKHRRMKIYYLKGTRCSMEGCDRVGTRLIVTKKNDGSYHADVYTHDLVMMTIDHVIPLSMNGSDKTTNKVPMCQKCNEMKGNKFIGTTFPKDFNHEDAKDSKNIKRYKKRWRKFIRKHAIFHPSINDLIHDYSFIEKNKLHSVNK